MLDVSIIIPSWNAKGFIKDCLISVFQDLGDYRRELIVVDNASTDGSSEMVEEQFDQVELIKNKANLGFAKACNIGMRKATGKYLVLVNSDVIVGKECIGRMCDYFDQHPEIGILGPKILGPDRSVQRSCMGSPTLWNSFCRALALDTIFPKSKLFGGQLMTFWSHDTIRSVDVINGCFWMVRREAINQVGLLDEQFFIYSEDKDWCKRFRNAGWKVVFFPEAEAIHFGGGSSSNAPIRFHVEMYRANLQYWRKHHSRAAQKSLILILLFHHLSRVVLQMLTLIFLSSKRKHSVFKVKRNIAVIRWLLEHSIQPWTKTAIKEQVNK